MDCCARAGGARFRAIKLEQAIAARRNLRQEINVGSIRSCSGPRILACVSGFSQFRANRAIDARRPGKIGCERGEGGMMRRREFVAGSAAAALLGGMPGRAENVKQFRLGVITDEITQDFEKALLWIKGFGLEWVELRFVWDKYVTDLTADEVKRAK